MNRFGGPKRFGGNNRGFRRFPRKMTKIKCSDCGKEAEVPFQPREGTPVYCRECFMKRKTGEGNAPKPQDSEETKEAEESEKEIEQYKESEEDEEEEEDW